MSFRSTPAPVATTATQAPRLAFVLTAGIEQLALGADTCTRPRLSTPPPKQIEKPKSVIGKEKEKATPQVEEKQGTLCEQCELLAFTQEDEVKLLVEAAEASDRVNPSEASEEVLNLSIVMGVNRVLEHAGVANEDYVDDFFEAADFYLAYLSFSSDGVNSKISTTNTGAAWDDPQKGQRPRAKFNDVELKTLLNGYFNRVTSFKANVRKRDWSAAREALLLLGPAMLDLIASFVKLFYSPGIMNRLNIAYEVAKYATPIGIYSKVTGLTTMASRFNWAATAIAADSKAQELKDGWGNSLFSWEGLDPRDLPALVTGTYVSPSGPRGQATLIAEKVAAAGWMVSTVSALSVNGRIALYMGWIATRAIIKVVEFGEDSVSEYAKVNSSEEGNKWATELKRKVGSSRPTPDAIKNGYIDEIDTNLRNWHEALESVKNAMRDKPSEQSGIDPRDFTVAILDSAMQFVATQTPVAAIVYANWRRNTRTALAAMDNEIERMHQLAARVDLLPQPPIVVD